MRARATLREKDSESDTERIVTGGESGARRTLREEDSRCGGHQARGGQRGRFGASRPSRATLCEKDSEGEGDTARGGHCVRKTARSHSTNFKSALRTLRILKVRNSYHHDSQGQKLILRMDSDLMII